MDKNSLEKHCVLLKGATPVAGNLTCHLKATMNFLCVCAVKFYLANQPNQPNQPIDLEEKEKKGWFWFEAI